MNVHVTVELDGDTLVAVKTATAAPAVERLRHEAARLAEASHPGVVRLVACRDLEPPVPAGGERSEGGEAGLAPCELRTAYAGEALTRWTASLADVAGVAASVASTLADLHEAGLVHGRLDASHVLLGDGGRPRLCGWSGPDGAPPADDVAAWGALVEGLLARTPAPRRGLRPAARGAGPGARRALLAVVDRAADPIPTRRPSARALADMVIAAVPGAALPEARSTAGRPAVAEFGVAPATRPRGDTLDRIWSYAGEPSEAERWAAALGSVPDDLEPATPDRYALPLARVDVLDWDAPPGDGRGAGGDAVPPFRNEPLEDTPPAVAVADDDRTRDHVPVGTRRRPRPEDDAARVAARRGGRVTAVGAAVGMAALVAVGLTVAASARGPGGDADATRPAASGPSCPPAPPPATDVDGDGCRETVTVDGSTIDAGGARWTLGEPGDLVTVGDWNCDGNVSAALLRPATGDVFVFSTWAELDRQVTVSAVDQVVGGTAVRTEPAGEGGPPCDRLVVDVAGGGETAVTVPA